LQRQVLVQFARQGTVRVFTAAVLAVVIGGALSRQPGQSVGSIAGVVVDDRGATVVAAHLTLTAVDRRTARRARTDADGRFVLPGVPAGRYTLSVYKPGYIRTEHGTRVPGGPGALIDLRPDERREDVRVTLPRGGVIAGTILDPDGAPAAGVDVRALRVVARNGERRWQQVGGDRTDDRGSYRVFQLQPGDYLVSAMPDEPGAGYAPVYYPGTIAFQSAGRVRLAPAEERSGVDLQLQLQATVTIRGSLHAGGQAAGCLPSVAILPVASPQWPAPVDAAQASVADGRFEIGDVAPGQYRLSARCAAAGRGQWYWAEREISVGADGLDDLALVLQTGMTVTGRVVFDGLSPPAPTGTRVTLAPLGAEAAEVGGATATGHVDVTGRFAVTGLPPGRYDVVVIPASDGARRWRPHSAIAAGRDALDFGLDVRPRDVVDVLITLSDRTQGVTGTVADETGQPAAAGVVVLFSTDSRYWLPDSRRVHIVPIAPDGGFAVSHVPPGEYRIVAVSGTMTTDDWADPSLLEQLSASAAPVTVARGVHTSRQLQVRR
jgi:hypothetical protein